ncbi:DUF1617 family protein [uncultured Clostridium sp.]|uniref:DUF1617 family protein n=1 Tax=uncultured Clostridium sp. TaxID=59620 RepID=UPI0026713760|nr:DUF1617 family protein [uncultured Clostridium sp.]
MKLSNEKILNTINVLGNLNNTQLPIKLAYAISKNINKIDIELKTYNDEKVKLINKYAEKDKEGKVISDEHGHIIIEEKHKEDWNNDISELLSIENEIDIHKIQLDDLLNANYNISPAELSMIDFMIED